MSIPVDGGTNMILRITFSFLILLTLFAATGFAGGDSAPQWLQQAASIKTPDYGKDVKAVVRRKDQQATLDPSGKLVTVDRYAVKILTREGRREAAAVAFYLSNFSQVRDMGAWLISPTGTVKEYGKKDIIDRISDTDDIYDEGRIKIIDASGDS